MRSWTVTFVVLMFVRSGFGRHDRCAATFAIPFTNPADLCCLPPFLHVSIVDNVDTFANVEYNQIKKEAPKAKDKRLYIFAPSPLESGQTFPPKETAVSATATEDPVRSFLTSQSAVKRNSAHIRKRCNDATNISSTKRSRPTLESRRWDVRLHHHQRETQ